MPTYKSPGVYVEEVPPLSRPIAGVGTSTPGFIGVIPNDIDLPARPADGDAAAIKTAGFKFVKYTIVAPAKQVYLVSSWSQFVRLFGDFIGDSAQPATGTTAPAVNAGQRNLAHAVFGFFNNGGASCYVTRVTSEGDLGAALTAFAAIDDIAMVAAPGFTSAAAYTQLISHCERLQDRVAILDPVETNPSFDAGDFSKLEAVITSTAMGRPQNSTYAAFYFPWVQTFDPATNVLQASKGPGLAFVPPSGHIAGIYARSDTTRGVHKAPANEALLGVTDLRYWLSKEQQEKLNDNGVNVIRPLVGAFRVWGARTVGGDANGEYRYISTRRYFNYLRESIDEGTQFVVFEPNTPALWERIKRTVGGFLLNEWRQGALFGTTPEKAFYVKCDADTNPPSEREAGRVITEIGVAIVRPAEFVIFRIMQVTGA
jgi:Bacteriophage tail sheath protein